MGDPSVIKSVYVGKTTNEEFRMSHFVTSTALSQFFSKTSRLFLIRSRKFTSPDLAQADEAMLIVSDLCNRYTILKTSWLGLFDFILFF